MSTTEQSTENLVQNLGLNSAIKLENITEHNNNLKQETEMRIPDITERRYEELCRTVINDMNVFGLSVIDDFLGREKGLQILNEVHRMYSAGVFTDGQIASPANTGRKIRAIRNDKIAWVRGSQDGYSNIGYLINQIDTVICRANTMNNNGQLGDYLIRERTKAMVACYPGSGAQYKMHVDNPNKDGRVITAIYYLNVDWDQKKSGGVLRIFRKQDDKVADIEPKFDRLLFFWSDIRNPHEVQPAHRTRYAITVWYFDASEREKARNRKRTAALTNSSNSTATETVAGAATTTTTTSSSTSSSPANNSSASQNFHQSQLTTSNAFT